MADISTEINKITQAVYGEEVRGSIRDALTAMNEEAEHAEAWATGGSGGTPSATNNAKYYAEHADEAAQAWATGGTGGTPSATNNAMYYAGQADARARAWGDGTTPEGDPIPDTDPAYGISAKDWADAAAASAATLELDPTLTENDQAAQAAAVGEALAGLEPAMEMAATPAGYTRLQYLQSDRRCTIDTGIYLNSSDRMIMSWAAVAIAENEYTNFIAGARATASSRAFVLGQNTVNEIRVNYGTSGDVHYGRVRDLNFHTLDLNAGSLYMDGEKLAERTETAFTTPRTCWVFAIHTTTTNQYGASKIAWFKIYDTNGDIRCSLVPVRRNSDNALGMWDYVSSAFIPNSGEGTLTAGPELTISSMQNDILQLQQKAGQKISRFKDNDAAYINFNITISQKWPDDTSDTTANAEYDGEQVTRQCILTLPDNYDPDGIPVPLIMMGHGFSGYISGSTWYNAAYSSAMKAIASAYKAAGFAVYDVDNTLADHSGDGTQDWGCLALMSEYIKAWEYIKQNYNVESRLYIHSFSMGTFAALNMAAWFPGQVAAMVNSAPRVDLVHRYETLGDTSRAAFDTIWNMDTTIEDKAARWNKPWLQGFLHYEKIVTVNETSMLFRQLPPTKVLIGGADTDGTGAGGYKHQTHAYAFYQAAANGGSYISLRTVAGKDHSAMCFLRTEDGMADVRQECVDWMCRFHNAPEENA